jgi:D-alanyl-D-alanine carboxypeptidase (penicillin-binding protein 5/6)
MPDRFIPRAALAVAAAGLAAAAVAAPASAAGTGGPRAIGGAQLSGRGVIVDYGSSGARKLPDVKASAFVIADADTGQVLAAKDPHGWYRGRKQAGHLRFAERGRPDLRARL